jgi:putative colanic acid biosynthesis acetyltransferase WcaF
VNLPVDNRLSRTQNRRRDRWARLLWRIAWLLLFRVSPAPLHGWRRLLLRCFGSRIGRGVHVNRSARVWAPWNLRIGDYSTLGPRVEVYNVAPVTIGEHAIVSQYAYLCAATHDYTDSRRPLIAEPITVGSGVWICADVFVGPGVTVGDMAVVGARSVVIKDQPEWMVCAGNPCRPIKRRVMKDEPDGAHLED